MDCVGVDGVVHPSAAFFAGDEACFVEFVHVEGHGGLGDAEFLGEVAGAGGAGGAGGDVA